MYESLVCCFSYWNFQGPPVDTIWYNDTFQHFFNLYSNLCFYYLISLFQLSILKSLIKDFFRFCLENKAIFGPKYVFD